MIFNKYKFLFFSFIIRDHSSKLHNNFPKKLFAEIDGVLMLNYMNLINQNY